MSRLLTGLVIAGAIVSAVLLLPSLPLLGLLTVVGAWAAYEFYRLAERMSSPAPIGPVWFCLSVVLLVALATQFSERLPARDLALASGAFLLALGTIPVFRAHEPTAGSIAWVAWAIFGPVYVAVPVAATYELHRLDHWLVFLLLAVVGLGDTAAFYVGRRWGRRRLAPRLSPKKTIEGSLAAVATAIFAAAAYSFLRLGELDWRLLVLAAFTQITAQLGDLFESALKRGAGVKDSGALLPGHGGVLDRCDAMMLAAPVFYFGCLLAAAQRWT